MVYDVTVLVAIVCEPLGDTVPMFGEREALVTSEEDVHASSAVVPDASLAMTDEERLQVGGMPLPGVVGVEGEEGEAESGDEPDEEEEPEDIAAEE